MHFARKLATHDGFRHLTGLPEPLEIDAGFDAHPVQCVHQVFRGEVARCSRRIRTSAKTGDRRVERRDARLQTDENVRERCPARVVKMKRDLFARNGRGEQL